MLLNSLLMTGRAHTTRNVELPAFLGATLLLIRDSTHGVTTSPLPRSTEQCLMKINGPVFCGMSGVHIKEHPLSSNDVRQFLSNISLQAGCAN